MVVVLQLFLFHLHGLEGHPQQKSFASLLELGTGNDQVQSVLPCSQQERKRGEVCPPGVAKVVFAVAYSRFGLPCGSRGGEQRAVLLVTNEWMMSPGWFPRQEIHPKEFSFNTESAVTCTE